MADDVTTAADEYDGRFLAGLVDIDAAPTIAQAMQIPQVPLLLVVLDGRPAAQPIPGVLSLDEIRTLLNQLAQGLTAQGVTGRHQPLHSAPVDGDDGEPQVDPRYAAAQQALESNDIDACGRGVPAARRRQPGRHRGRGRAGDGQGAAAHRRASTSRLRGRPLPRPPTTSTRRRWSPTSTCSAVTSTTPSTAWSTLVRRTAGDERNRRAST